jgi:hypothetical protein
VRRSSGSTERRGRIGRTVALVLAIAGVSLATAAYMIQHGSDTHRDALARPVPPVLRTKPAPHTASPVPTTSATHLVARPRPLIAPIRPTHLFIPSIGVNTKVIGKPTEFDHDPFLHRTVPSFGVPDDMYTTTWWSSGPLPGSAGLAIVLGHTQIGGYGVFNRLGAVRRGAVVGLTRGDDVLRFAVLSVVRGISKRRADDLRHVLVTPPSGARLALLTCSGRFNGTVHESVENTVVFARLVSAS